VLLQLPQGTSILLKETLYKSLHQFDGEKNVSTVADKRQLNSTKENHALATRNAKNALKEFGILKLSSEQAELVLSLRISF
jgi:hypothetical protein